MLRNLVVREGRRTGQLQTRLVTSAAQIPRPPVDLHTVIEGPGRRHRRADRRARRRAPDEELCGLRFRVSHAAFLQTNTEMAERLYAIAGELAGLSGRERVFDLFCGIGTIGLSLAARAGEVWGLEVVPEAIADAEAQRALQRDRERALRRRRRPPRDRAAARARPGRPDVVVVDPPAPGSRRRSCAG